MKKKKDSVKILILEKSFEITRGKKLRFYFSWIPWKDLQFLWFSGLFCKSSLSSWTFKHNILEFRTLKKQLMRKIKMITTILTLVAYGDYTFKEMNFHLVVCFLTYILKFLYFIFKFLYDVMLNMRYIVSKWSKWHNKLPQHFKILLRHVPSPKK